ncbi:MAG: hypothetical protein EB136_07295 [Synechococcaceae bacterium WBB_3_034]|nr:hypothetical protein [Synechococcaceae bacterium WBB_3_034]
MPQRRLPPWRSPCSGVGSRWAACCLPGWPGSSRRGCCCRGCRCFSRWCSRPSAASAVVMPAPPWCCSPVRAWAVRRCCR